MFIGAIVFSAGLLALGYEYLLEQADLPVYGPTETVDNVVTEHTIPVFSLIAEDGGTFNSRVLKNKVVVTNFFFTSCPSVCPRMMRNLQSVHELYRDDESVSLVSITVDPQHDTPERLRKYAEALHADTDRWRFLTGEKKEIYPLARHGYYISAADGGSQEHDFIHSENLVLSDGLGRIRGYYNGLDEQAVDQLVEDILKLKKERS
jgi:protein SCO1/2